MAFFTLKLSIWFVVLSVLICVLCAQSDGRENMELSLQEPTDDYILNEYNTNLNQGSYVDKLSKIIDSKRRISSNLKQLSSKKLYGLADQQKRQIRYHQCYFNPISCFKKRK